MLSGSSGLSFQVRVADQASALSGYEEMTYPLFVPLLKRVGTDPAILAIVAANGGTPIGLALAEILPSGISGIVRSVFVEPSSRRKGCALAMLGVVDQELRARAVPRVTGSYAKNPAVDALLVRAGWVEPQPSMFLYHANKTALEGLERASFFRVTELRPGLEIVPWDQLTPEDHATIAEAVVRFSVPEGLTSRTEPALIDPELSLGLRVDGTVYAWLLVHRTGPERRRYTGLYARPDCPVKGMGIRLVFESVRKRIAQMRSLTDADATWGCIATMSMAGFTQRQVVPFLPGVKVTETVQSWKDLAQN